MDNIQQTLKFKINYPYLRAEIKDAFKELSDFEKQQTMWLKGSKQSSCSYCNNLWYHALYALYEDRDLDEYKEENIGKYFYNEEEAKQVYEFCKWFRDLLDLIDPYCTFNQPDSAYFEHPEWHKVYSGAKKLFELMDANDKKYNFNQEYEEYYKLQFPNYGKE